MCFFKIAQKKHPRVTPRGGLLSATVFQTDGRAAISPEIDFGTDGRADIQIEKMRTFFEKIRTLFEKTVFNFSEKWSLRPSV